MRTNDILVLFLSTENRKPHPSRVLSTPFYSGVQTRLSRRRPHQTNSRPSLPPVPSSASSSVPCQGRPPLPRRSHPTSKPHRSAPLHPSSSSPKNQPFPH